MACPNERGGKKLPASGVDVNISRVILESRGRKKEAIGVAIVLFQRLSDDVHMLRLRAEHSPDLTKLGLSLASLACNIPKPLYITPWILLFAFYEGGAELPRT